MQPLRFKNHYQNLLWKAVPILCRSHTLISKSPEFSMISINDKFFVCCPDLPLWNPVDGNIRNHPLPFAYTFLQ
jgi:hypothetical protein